MGRIIPVGEYLPDLPVLDNPGAPYVDNVVPISTKAYGPMPSFAEYSTTALDSTCLGAWSIRDPSGNSYVFAGTAANLWQLEPGSTALTNVSASGGYSTGIGWSFDTINGVVFAANLSNAMQSATLASGAQFGPVTGAPSAQYIAAIEPGFLLAGYTNDVNGLNPQGISWSAIGNPTSWPTPGTIAAQTVQSDFQVVEGPHGNLQAIVPNLVYEPAILIFERGLFRMTYAGPPDIFDIQPIESARGTPAPNSCVALGGMSYYLGIDGFYSCDGIQSVPIGFGKIDRTFWQDVDQSNLQLVCGAVDLQNRLIFWAYPQANGNGSLNRILCFNPVINRWSRITGVTVEFLVKAFSSGYGIDGLSAISGIDTLPASLDSRIWTGGHPYLGGFDTSNKFGFFSGPSLAATVGTTEGQIGPDHARVTSVRPLTDGGSPSIQVLTRDRPIDHQVISNMVAMNNKGTCPIRRDGRYLSSRIYQPAGAAWQNIMGVDVETVVSGYR